MPDSDVAIADRLTRRRARVMTVLAIYFIASQGAVLTAIGNGDPGRLNTVGAVHFGAWLAMAIALVALLVTGGGWFRSPAVRALINDERSRENRARALNLGFFNAMATAFFIYFLTFWTPVTGREAIHVVMTVGIASALLAFAVRERRDLADG